MEKEDKNNANVSASPDLEMCASAHSVHAQQETLKRDLGSRHINMIAIAGMIVSVARRLPISDGAIDKLVGHRSLPQLWPSYRNGRTRRRFAGIYCYGIRHCGCCLYYWRDHRVHAEYWGFYQTRNEIC